MALLLFLEARDGCAIGFDRRKVGLRRENLPDHAFAVNANLLPVGPHFPQKPFLFFPPLPALFRAEVEVLRQVVVLGVGMQIGPAAVLPGLVAHRAQHADVEKEGKRKQCIKPGTFHQILSFG